MSQYRPKFSPIKFELLSTEFYRRLGNQRNRHARLMFLADFTHYALHGESITGLMYMKASEEHVGFGLASETNDEIVEELSPTELAVVDLIVKNGGVFDPPEKFFRSPLWGDIGLLEEIPYEVVFLPLSPEDQRLSDEDVAFGRKVLEALDG
jgi:hypothetical protein